MERTDTWETESGECLLDHERRVSTPEQDSPSKQRDGTSRVEVKLDEILALLRDTTNQDKNSWLTPTQAAQYCGVSERTLRDWKRKRLVAAHVIDSVVRYRREDLDAALRRFRLKARVL